MSEILIGSNPDNPKIVGAINLEAPNEEKAKALPEPSGYRILVAIPEIEKEMELGDSGVSLIKADQTLHYEEVLSTVIFVVKMGPDCYNDAEKFPDGPWCEQGDFVITRPYSGTRIMIHGKEFRLINDDQVEATVEDPRGISRV